ncbi:MAG: hypothetical protein M3O15_10735 [Acidobacteriota bacterium]|nr:hypothetical protein [Acidobacteriota bacterium]
MSPRSPCPGTLPSLALLLALTLGAEIVAIPDGAEAAGAGPALPAVPATQAKAAAAPVAETYALQAKDLADDLLRLSIGIATVAVGIGESGAEEEALRFRREGDSFYPAGRLRLADTQPVSTFRVGTDAAVTRSRALARRYLAIERKGTYVRVALDPAGKRTEWLRLTPEGAFPNSVELVDFDDGSSYRCSQLDLYFLAGGAPRRLFEKPDAKAPARPLTREAGKPGYFEGDLVPLSRKGNFLEVAEVKGLNDPRTSIGWLELRAPNGRLLLWFTPVPDC